MRVPYDIYEAVVGKYDPDNPPSPPFSVWMSEQKAAYLKARPEAARNQIDGHFFEAELQRFFEWLDRQHQGGPHV